jgi:hypothetical protein
MVAEDATTSGQSADSYIFDANEETSITQAKMVAKDKDAIDDGKEIYISDANERT